MNTLKLKLETLIKETSQEVDNIFKREQGSFLYHYTQGKLNAYRELLSGTNDTGTIQTESTFIMVLDSKDKQHMFPKHKVEYVTANPELLTIYIIIEAGESYGIFFDDDQEKFSLQVDYLHKQLGILI